MSKFAGNIAEDKAAEHLKRNGFKIIKRNFYSKFGEIDIIARKDGELHFVEVKSGKNFDPIYNITPSKLNKITKTINYYILKEDTDEPFCVDAIIIKDNGVEFVENVTLA